MRFALPLLLAVLALPAYAADTPSVTAAKPAAKTAAAKPAAKTVAPVAEPQPDPLTLINQARDAQNRGESDLALRLAQAAIVADPARPASYDALADLYIALNQPEAARSYFGEALSIDPNDASAQTGMASLDHGSPQKPAQQSAQAQDQDAKTGTP
jgi:tetratricopeptide (TPR) repeat protein